MFFSSRREKESDEESDSYFGEYFGACMGYSVYTGKNNYLGK